jgi:hypothetical protein
VVASLADAEKGTEKQPVINRGDAELAKDAESLARKFLEATSVAELLPLVHRPEVAEARMREFYAGKEIEALGFSKFDASGAFNLKDKAMVFQFLARDQEQKSLVFKHSPEGLKIDWECWVGWSDISWEKFLAEKPTTGHAFRVMLTAVEYYNFAFTDEGKWQSYRLLSPDSEYSIYGYVEKNTVLDQKVRPREGARVLPLVLKLKFPPGATSNTQVEIESLVSDGWVLYDEKP